MDPRCLYLQKHQLPELIDGLVAKLAEAQPSNPRQFLANQLAALADGRYSSADQAFNPTYSRTLAAKTITATQYAKYRNEHTVLGATLDLCLQDGLDHATGGVTPLAGMRPLAGLVAADEDTFVTLGELVDDVLNAKHGVRYLGNKAAQYYSNDVTMNKLKGGFTFDEKIVSRIVVRMRRNIGGMRFAPSITRAERREVERILRDAKSRFGAVNAGRWFTVAGMPTPLEATVPQGAALLPQHFASPVRTAYRDWPDARGIFLADDWRAAYHANCGSEHLEVVTVAGQNHNVREAFDRAVEWIGMLDEAVRAAGKEYAMHPKLGALTADLGLIGSGMTVEAVVHFPRLANHARFDDILRKLRVCVQQDFTGNPSFGKNRVAASFSSTIAPEVDASAMAASPCSTSLGATQRGDDPVADTPPFTLVNEATLSCSPVDALQSVIDAIGRMADLESALERSQALDM